MALFKREWDKIEHYENIMSRIKTLGDATKESEFDIFLMFDNSFILPTLNKSLFGFFFLLSVCLGKMALRQNFWIKWSS